MTLPGEVGMKRLLDDMSTDDEATAYAKRELADGRASIDVIMDLERMYGLKPMEAEDIVTALEEADDEHVP